MAHLADGIRVEDRVYESYCAYRGEEEDVARVIRSLVEARVDILGLTEIKADLESVFMAVTRGAVQ